jgi:uncharacterized protein
MAIRRLRISGASQAICTHRPTPVSACAGAPRARCAPQAWLHLRADARVPLTCQRCLGPVQTPIEVDRWFRFVADEATAEAQDDDSEEDLLALEPRPSLIEIIEDELIMSLPLVPVHERCPQPLPDGGGSQAEGDQGGGSERPHPFAGLAKLKGRS